MDYLTAIVAEFVIFFMTNVIYIWVVTMLILGMVGGSLLADLLGRPKKKKMKRSPVAQSVERSAVNRSVVGSSPTRGATKKGKAPVVTEYSEEYKLPPSPFD